MANTNLRAIRDSLAVLPGLERNLKRLQEKIYKAEERAKRLKWQYEEKVDEVEVLDRGSFSNLILKLTGRYYKRRDRAVEEAHSLKLEYDEALNESDRLYRERGQLSERIRGFRDEERTYEEEIRRRERVLVEDSTSQIGIKYDEFEERRKDSIEKRSQVNRAMGAARSVKNSIGDAMKSLDSAHSWATYDVWTKGGLFSHLAKYDHIDSAQSAFKKIDSQLKGLKRQLAGIDTSGMVEFTDVSSTTRAIDYWFDNIFTDLSVRTTIRENQDALRKLNRNLDGIISKLNRCKTQLQRDIDSAEYEKEELLISMDS